VPDDAPLETGYGPAVSPGDNVLNDFVRGTATSFAAFGRARGDRVQGIDGVATLWDAGSPLPFFNRATIETPVSDLDTLLDTLHAFYGENPGGGPFLLDTAWPVADLSGRGYTLMGHPPLMLRAADLPLADPPPELRVIRADDEQAAFDFEHVLAYGYPAPPMQPVTKPTVLTGSTLDAEGWHHYVGYVDDRPVTAGSAYVGDRLVRVDNIATLDDARGRGYGNAITAAAVASDLSKPATLIASDLGRPVYEKLGFVALLRVTYWLGPRTT